MFVSTLCIFVIGHTQRKTEILFDNNFNKLDIDSAKRADTVATNGYTFEWIDPEGNFMRSFYPPSMILRVDWKIEEIV
jgi:hypothetical protein